MRSNEFYFLNNVQGLLCLFEITLNNTITMENLEKKEIIITECLVCGTRYENYFYASPCCNAIVLKVDKDGNRTHITFLSVLSLPQPHLAKKVSGVKLEKKML